MYSAFVSSHDKYILSLSLMWCLQWHIASCNYSMKVNLYPEGLAVCVWIIKRDVEGKETTQSPINSSFQHSSQCANMALSV